MDTVLKTDLDLPCDQAGRYCSGPVDEVEGDWEDTEELLCRAHQKVYGQGHYARSDTGWPR